MTPVIKICGIADPEALRAALAARVDMVGFVRFPRSPRHVDLSTGCALSQAARGRAARVLLLVDPTDPDLDEAVAAIDPDLIQLHGAESPERVAAIRARLGRPVMKAVGIGGPADLALAASYRGIADRLLLDARPPAGAALPGGNGAAFDWRLLADAALDPETTMLSGGLTAANVAEAVAVTGLSAVDVSSGVEASPGVKDPALVVAFVAAARQAFAAAGGPGRTAA